MSSKENGRALIGLIWLRLEESNGLFWTRAIWVSQNADSFLTSWETIRFSEWAVLH